MEFACVACVCRSVSVQYYIGFTVSSIQPQLSYEKQGKAEAVTYNLGCGIISIRRTLFNISGRFQSCVKHLAFTNAKLIVLST